MSPLKRNGILICSVLFYPANFIFIKVVATYIIQFNCVSTLKQVYSSDFSLFGAEAFRERYKKLKMESYGSGSGGSWGPVSPVGGETRKTWRGEEEQEGQKKQRQEAARPGLRERRQYDEMVVKTCLLKHNKDPHKQKLREAIRNRVDSYSKSIVKASSGLMHLVREMYRDVTHVEMVEIPDEFFDKTFVRQLMLGTEETWRENERVHVLHENFAKFCFEGTRYKGDRDIYDYGAMKYLTNLKNHLNMNLERFMIRACLHSTRICLAMENGRLSTASRKIASVKMRSSSLTRRRQTRARMKLL